MTAVVDAMVDVFVVDVVVMIAFAVAPPYRVGRIAAGVDAGDKEVAAPEQQLESWNMNQQVVVVAVVAVVVAVAVVVVVALIEQRVAWAVVRRHAFDCQ